MPQTRLPQRRLRNRVLAVVLRFVVHGDGLLALERGGRGLGEAGL